MAVARQRPRYQRGRRRDEGAIYRAAKNELVETLANFVLSIIGAIKSNGGNGYRYPFVLRLVK